MGKLQVRSEWQPERCADRIRRALRGTVLTADTPSRGARISWPPAQAGQPPSALTSAGRENRCSRPSDRLPGDPHTLQSDAFKSRGSAVTHDHYRARNASDRGVARARVPAGHVGVRDERRAGRDQPVAPIEAVLQLQSHLPVRRRRLESQSCQELLRETCEWNRRVVAALRAVGVAQVGVFAEELQWSEHGVPVVCATGTRQLGRTSACDSFPPEPLKSPKTLLVRGARDKTTLEVGFRVSKSPALSSRNLSPGAWPASLPLGRGDLEVDGAVRRGESRGDPPGPRRQRDREA